MAGGQSTGARCRRSVYGLQAVGRSVPGAGGKVYELQAVQVPAARW